MTKKFFVSIVCCLVAAVANAQNVEVAQSTLTVLEESTAASPKTDRGCLDMRRRPDGSLEVVNCAGWYLTAGAGASQLNWSNNDGEEGDQLAVEYKASLGYRFMHIDWICALRIQADVYVNGPTRVENLRQGFTPGFGATLLGEFNPHGAVRFGIGGAVKTRNLTSLCKRVYQFEEGTIADTDKYGGNVVLYGPVVNINMPLFKVYSKSKTLVNGNPYTVHRGVSLNLDIQGSYMMGTIQKTWVDEAHKVDFKEAGLVASLQLKF